MTTRRTFLSALGILPAASLAKASPIPDDRVARLESLAVCLHGVPRKDARIYIYGPQAMHLLGALHPERWEVGIRGVTFEAQRRFPASAGYADSLAARARREDGPAPLVKLADELRTLSEAGAHVSLGSGWRDAVDYLAAAGGTVEETPLTGIHRFMARLNVRGVRFSAYCKTPPRALAKGA